jgi:GR25 family glycosyltransferase involved in LPS biosynthesis
MFSQNSSAKIPVVIIEIPGSARSKKLIQQLSKSEILDINIFEAVMFKRSMTNFAPNFAKQHLLYGRELSDGEIGCAISHYLIQEAHREKSQSIVVLEDDARIPNLNAFENIIKRFIESKNETNSILSLLPWNLNSRIEEKRYPRHASHRLFGRTPLTVGYVITPLAMKELSLANFDFAYLPDWPPSRTKFFTSALGVVDHGDLETFSYIDNGGRQKTSRLTAFRRFSPMTYFGHRSQFRSFEEYFRATYLPSITWRMDNTMVKIFLKKRFKC